MAQRRSSIVDGLKFNRQDDSEDEDFDSRRGNAEDVLRRLKDQNGDLEQELLGAHEILRSDPQYAASMHAVTRSLRRRSIEVFVSYRSQRDAPAARALAQAFRELSDGHVKLTIADEFATSISGRDFKEEIERRIIDAYWFVLLVSDSKASTDWCMFETGMFRGTMVSKKVNRLICIHHPDAVLPDPIDEFQAIKATEEGLSQFFDGLFRQPAPLPGWAALNPAVDPSAISAAAALVADAFAPPSEPIRLHPQVKLTIPNAIDLTGPTDLEQASIETDQRTTDMFGKTSEPRRWGKLVDSIEAKNRASKWLIELTAVLAKTRRHERSRPVSGTFETDVGGKIMRPIVQSMEEGRTETTFEIVFVEEICSAPIQRLDPQILALQTAVRMHDRIRWEVMEEFGGKEWNLEAIDRCSNLFSRIEREASSFGQWNLGLLCDNFDEETRPEVARVLERWRKLRAAGTSATEYMTGELDIAFQAGDVAQVTRSFAECADLNRRFLGMAQPTMQSLVAQSSN